ncbi:MAG: hypothetical protein QW331_02830 [Candidatus Woesearchaeota archaeon]
MPLGITEITLSIIVGTLAAIIYCLRILVIMERRVERIERHIEAVTEKLLKEEIFIESVLKKRKR